MLELIEKETAKKLLEAALPTIIDEDSGEYVLGINTAYGLISSIQPVAVSIEEPQMANWTSVDDGYPAHEYGEGDSVLTVDVLGQMRVLYFNGCWCWPTGECLVTARKFPVTHWMPLPKLPKEE